MFSMFVPRARGPVAALPMPRTGLPDSLSGMRVLCVDNDSDILAGMAALLGRWEVEVLRAATVDEALAKMAGKPDVLLVDYPLHDRLDGLDTLDALRPGNRQLPGALLTDDGRDTLKKAARAPRHRVRPTPAKPAPPR